MTIAALEVGKQIANTRTGRSGRPFSIALIAARTDDESVLCSLTAFGTAGERMAALSKGDGMAMVVSSRLQARLKDGVPRAGLDSASDQIQTAYHRSRKCLAMAGAADSAPAGRLPRSARPSEVGGHRGVVPNIDSSIGFALLEFLRQTNGGAQHHKVWLFFSHRCQQYGINRDRRPTTLVEFNGVFEEEGEANK